MKQMKTRAREGKAAIGASTLLRRDINVFLI